MIEALQGDELACGDCGRRVRQPIHVEQVVAHGRERLLDVGVRVVADAQIAIDTVRCSVCTARYARAESLLNVYPAIRFALGSRSYAVAKMNAALVGLDALGTSPKHIERLLSEPRLVRAVLDELSVPGYAASWIGQFAPVWAHGADIQTCSSDPWGFVSEAVQQKLRDGYAKVLGVMMDKPEDFVCPGGDGCLLCGVHSVRALRSEALAGGVWSGIYEAQPGVLGGVRRAENVRGYMCGPCADAVEKTGGGIGMRALEIALGNFLGVGAPSEDRGLKGLRAWCAMPKGTPPNSTPWAHEPDHDEIRDLISKNRLGITVSFV
jgi:hypothetical protein